MTRTLLIALLLSFLPLSPAQGANSARNFGGVGIDGLPQADGQIVVRQLVAGGPAHLAGIKAGDIITHVDGKPTRGSDFKQMVERRLRGRAGTKVVVTIHRPGEARLLNFTLTRRQLQVAGSGGGNQPKAHAP
jgi:C-terminal processing protease CtpA/Prc